jgi:hypothetical protein
MQVIRVHGTRGRGLAFPGGFFGKLCKANPSSLEPGPGEPDDSGSQQLSAAIYFLIRLVRNVLCCYVVCSFSCFSLLP